MGRMWKSSRTMGSKGCRKGSRTMGNDTLPFALLPFHLLLLKLAGLYTQKGHSYNRHDE